MYTNLRFSIRDNWLSNKSLQQGFPAFDDDFATNFTLGVTITSRNIIVYILHTEKI